MMRFYLNFFFLLSVIISYSCEKDASAPVNKGNNIVLSSQVDASQTTATEASVRFILVELNGNKVIEQGICFGTSPQPIISTNRVPLAISASNQLCRLSGLIPAKQYYVRSYVTTSNGTFYGNDQSFITLPADGLTSAKAAQNALQIKQNFPNSPDGVYWINLPVVGPKLVYCIMNPAVDGGGWMMMMKSRSNSTTFNYSSSYWTTKNVLNDSDITHYANDAKFDVMNYYPAVDMLALWPDIPSNYNGNTSGGRINLRYVYNQWSWLQRNFNNGNRIAPVDFFNTVSNLFISDANNFPGKGNVFSSQPDVRFYGFNYSRYGIAKVRWGFAWNENGGGLFPNGIDNSNDVSGGIGLDAAFGNFSAGDRYICNCNVQAGMNRSAGVEIYVR
jgi:hypothetical protein